MSAMTEARGHLTKAREFLEAARLSHEMGLFNAATASDAVVSGINSKDAICLRLTGVTRKGDSHADAVTELKAAGPVGAGLSPTLGRLLRLKTKSQYQSGSVAETDAAKMIHWADRMVAGAESALSARVGRAPTSCS